MNWPLDAQICGLSRLFVVVVVVVVVGGGGGGGGNGGGDDVVGVYQIQRLGAHSIIVNDVIDTF